MRGFDTKFLDELKSKSDITEVIGRYVHLEQRGPNYWGRCPFHHEKTASFCVNGIDQFYYCFGCHKGGDVIKFIEEIESLDFFDAVKLLAEKAKMEIPSITYEDDRIKEQKSKKETVLSILKETARFYANNLRNGDSAAHKEYIARRGLSDEILNKFGVGASLDYESLPNYLKTKGYSYDDMVLSGAVSVSSKGRYFDALAGRLIIPVIDQFNNVVAFCGRIITERKDVGKYVNTRETLVFSKGKTLFNLNNLKKHKNEVGLKDIIIVEGHMDVISLVQAGFNNVVASMGTALTKDQARIIKRFANSVYISYDGDFAGQKASIRGLEILKDEGLEVKVVSLPDGFDPDDVIKKQGKDAYEKLLSEAKLLIDFKLDILKRTFDIGTVDGKRKFIKESLRVIASSESASEKEDLLKAMRDMTGITYESLKRELSDFENGVVRTEAPIIETITGDRLSQAEKYVLHGYLFNKSYVKDVDIKSIEFPTATGKFLQQYVVKENGNLIKPNLVFDCADESMHDDIKEIFKIELAENKGLDEERFFKDCVNSLKTETIDKKIDNLTKLYKSATDIDERKAIASELKELMIAKNGLN